MTCNEKNFDCHTNCFPEGATFCIQHLHCCGNKGNDKPGVPGGTEKPIPMDLYVAKTGNDETGDGSQANPFLTIQRGVDEIEKLPLLEKRHNVYVGDGTYLENVVVKNLTFNLIGNVNNPQNVIVQSGVVGGGAFLAENANSNVEGFTFKASEYTGISANFCIGNHSKVVISNCIFYSDNKFTVDIMLYDKAFGSIINTTFKGPQRFCIFNPNTMSKLMTFDGISIADDTVITSTLIYCHSLGTAEIYNPIVKTGTITGTRFRVNYLGQLHDKENLPETTIPGTDDRPNGSFAV
ncbi:MAG: hypothetical protein LBR56_03515 [Sporomusaceae bacterium]|jgi:hypothetical protein|nr:hypothetical protein [Sporomusaceae bacterium]